jgi:hypothetical protein
MYRDGTGALHERQFFSGRFNRIALVMFYFCS